MDPSTVHAVHGATGGWRAQEGLIVAAAVASYASDDASDVICLGLCVPEHQGKLQECASRTLFYVRTQR
ncbi:unnamed protein product [Sphagnum troendelagicum]|uniref:Uncharacterized protein n=1 Tax=Sphagnum troendelagicum TaxID=128251 RepID=A0ABP0V153_9BRYO